MPPEEAAHHGEDEHQPVLLAEMLDWLRGEPDGWYADLTVGLGGHLLPLTNQSGPQAKFVGMDRDADALSVAGARLAGRRHTEQEVHLIQSSYAGFSEVFGRLAGDSGLVAGIMLDLGLSSRQLNDASRGFAFRLDGPLDMRFDPADHSLRTAAEILAESSAEELADIFFTFGDEPHSRRLARTIERERGRQPLQSTRDLVALVEPLFPYRERNRSLARIFQALRIAVNDELGQLTRALPTLISRLSHRGRLAIITYHSLEDRLVKHFFRDAAKAEGLTDVTGAPLTLSILTRRPIEPSAGEITSNNRARSARLRVVERV